MIKHIYIVLLLLLPFGLRATTLLELGLEELVDESALIFTGTVLDVSVTEENDLVYSTVTFAVEDVVKGNASGEISLRFLGGEGVNIEVNVAGQLIPAPGDHGLYFVNDPDEEQVNPLTGWSQGYFPLIEADNGELYLDLRNHPNYELVLGAPDPLVEKMRTMGMSQEQIAARAPASFRFPLEDFIIAIDLVQRQGE